MVLLQVLVLNGWTYPRFICADKVSPDVQVASVDIGQILWSSFVMSFTLSYVAGFDMVACFSHEKRCLGVNTLFGS